MSGKTAIVTGASKGIGRSVAIKLAKDGFNVAINCSSERSLSAANLVKEECAQFGA